MSDTELVQAFHQLTKMNLDFFPIDKAILFFVHFKYHKLEILKKIKIIYF